MDCIAIVVHSSIRLKALINIKSILLNQISGFDESVIRYESHFSTLQMLTPNYVRIIKKQKISHIKQVIRFHSLFIRRNLNSKEPTKTKMIKIQNESRNQI